MGEPVGPPTPQSPLTTGETVSPSDGTTEGETNQYRMVVGFAYGSPSGIYGESASMGHVFMSTQIPTKVTTTIHYVDQKTGDDIATPKNFEGVGYQGYTITGLRQRLIATL